MPIFAALAQPFRYMNSRVGQYFVALLFLTTFSLASLAADPPAEDKIILMQSSSDGLIVDLEYMVKDLAKQQKQWTDTIEPNIELFLDGVDRTKPIRVDLFFDEKAGEYYRPFFPISSLSMFRNNLDALGITSKPVGKNLFKLESAFEGQMRVLPNYAAFAPTEWLTIIPESLPDPTIAIEAIVSPKYDAAVLIDHQAEGVDKRRKSLAKLRSNMLSEVKKKSTESVDEYNLRKLSAEHQFDKLAQLYAELDYLEAGWVTDRENKKGTGTLILSALPGTALDKNFKQIPQLKSRFSAIPQADPLVASGRLQLPVTVPSQERLSETYKAALPVINKKIDDHADMNASQKQASKEAVTKVIALLEKGFQLGMFELFGEMRPSAQKDLHEAIVGVQLVDGGDVEEIIKLIPKINEKFAVKSDVTQENDFKFHEITLTEKVPPMLNSLFGTPCQVSVATSDSILLVGFGATSMDWLKQTAKHLKEHPEGQTLPEFVRFKGHMQPFIKALNAREPNKDRPKLREMLVEAFSQGDDFIELSDKFVNNQVEGTLVVEPGLLRFLGLAVAKFAEENL